MKVVLNNEIEIIIKFASSIGDFVQKIKISDLDYFKSDFGIEFELFILTVSYEKYEWKKFVFQEEVNAIEMCSRILRHGDYRSEIPLHLGKIARIFTGVNDCFPYTATTINEYLYIISCCINKRFDIVYDTNTVSSSVENNFSKRKYSMIMQNKKKLLGFNFYNKNLDNNFFFNYTDFDINTFLDELFSNFNNSPLSFLEEIILFNRGFLSQFALLNHNEINSTFVIPEILWIYQLMYKKQHDLYLPHLSPVGTGTYLNQRVSGMRFYWYKSSTIKMNELKQGKILTIESNNKLIIKSGYFLIEVK